jgi:hypothetical protein
MREREPIDRCVAYAAARDALEAVHRALWPVELGDQARRAALETVMVTAESLSHAPATPARRRCVRSAISTAIELAAVCDIARAMGIEDIELDEAQRLSSRAIAMLGLLFHASASSFLAH